MIEKYERNIFNRYFALLFNNKISNMQNLYIFMTLHSLIVYRLFFKIIFYFYYFLYIELF